MPSLLEAIEMKYGVIEHQICGEQYMVAECSEADVSIFVPKKSPRISIPSLLVLNDFDIETAGDAKEIEHKCARVEELDLAMNKLEQWSEIISIIEHMPRLKFANLSFNTLTSPLNNKDIGVRWNHLRSLVLNSTHIDWRSVRQLVQLLPELEELHLSFNDYHKIDLEDLVPCQEALYLANSQSTSMKTPEIKCTCPISIDQFCIDTNNEFSETEDDLPNKPPNVQEPKSQPKHPTQKRTIIHEKIKKLHFTGNPVKEWYEVCKLGQSFPNLESLVLADCPIETLEVKCNTFDDNSVGDKQCSSHIVNRRISYERTESGCEADQNHEKRKMFISPHHYFRNLLYLNLNCSAIAEWGEIERIARFPKLQCLRIQGCPLWESHENTQHERRQLMVARLPNIGMLNGGGYITPEEREAAERAFIRHFLDTPEDQKPERYAELVEIHGQLEPLANVDMRPEKRVKVTFTFKERSEVRSVDVYRTVADLKTKLEPITGLQAARMRLFYVDQDFRHIQGPEEMKYASKQLYSYNIRSGDEIIIDQKKRTHSSTST